MRRVWVTSSSYEAAILFMVEARKNAGLSQRELAQRLGKPRSFVSKVENRERRLDFVEFIAYANALGVPSDRLMGRLVEQLGSPIVF